MKKNTIIGILGALGVIIGAFGAHGIKPHLSEIAYQNYQTGVWYHFIHTLAMFGVLIYDRLHPRLFNANLAFYAFGIGVLLFSGSLYLLSTRELTGWSGMNLLGPITPLGGLCFIVGWLTLIPWRSRKASE
jgi:uncharacterized membrane protein YgdD (TMEM256/DUF423 family)